MADGEGEMERKRGLAPYMGGINNQMTGQPLWGKLHVRVGKMTLKSEATKEKRLTMGHYLFLCPLERGAGLGPLPSLLAQADRANQGLPSRPVLDGGCLQLLTVSAATHLTIKVSLSAALTSHSESLTNGWRHIWCLQ